MHMHDIQSTSDDIWIISITEWHPGAPFEINHLCVCGGGGYVSCGFSFLFSLFDHFNVRLRLVFSSHCSSNDHLYYKLHSHD